MWGVKIAVEPAVTGAARTTTPTPEDCFQYIPKTGPHHLYVDFFLFFLNKCVIFLSFLSLFTVRISLFACAVVYILKNCIFSQLIPPPLYGWIYLGLFDFKQLKIARL